MYAESSEISAVLALFKENKDIQYDLKRVIHTIFHKKILSMRKRIPERKSLDVIGSDNGVWQR